MFTKMNTTIVSVCLMVALIVTATSYGEWREWRRPLHIKANGGKAKRIEFTGEKVHLYFHKDNALDDTIYVQQRRYRSIPGGLGIYEKVGPKRKLNRSNPVFLKTRHRDETLLVDFENRNWLGFNVRVLEGEWEDPDDPNDRRRD